MDKKAFGDHGERLAGKYLKRKGYKIVAKNYRTPFGEIDIVARDDASLVFVEVKTRSNTRHGYPEMNVHPAKLRHFVSAAQNFISEKGFECPYRLDVVSIDFSDGKADIRHFENITG